MSEKQSVCAVQPLKAEQYGWLFFCAQVLHTDSFKIDEGLLTNMKSQ